MHLTLDKDGSKTPAMLGSIVHTVTAAEETAEVVVLTTEALVVELPITQVFRAGVKIVDDSTYTVSGSTITITEKASTPTWAMTEGDIIVVTYVGGASA